MRGTRLSILVLGLGAFSASAAFCQTKPQFKLLDATRYDLSVGYNNIRANAPPGGCPCFDMNGGFAFGTVRLTDWLGISGEFTGGHSSNISNLGQGLTLTTFTVGPRVSHDSANLLLLAKCLPVERTEAVHTFQPKSPAMQLLPALPFLLEVDWMSASTGASPFARLICNTLEPPFPTASIMSRTN